MRFRVGVLVGIVIGYLIARRMVRQQGDGRASGVRAAMLRHPSSQRLAGFAERASTVGAQAIQRARASLQRRMVADVDDLSMN